MAATIQDLENWMRADENEHLEFKKAKTRFSFEDLVKYCVALANECGGKIILGVTDRRPRRVVGTSAFDNLERTKNGLFERLHLRIEVHRLSHPDGRVLVVDVPSRPIGHPIEYKGSYWMRAGESLVPMSPDQIKRILNETTPDFSAGVCEKASLNDLDPEAIQKFRTMWANHSNSPALLQHSDDQILTDTDLVTGEGITYAALILLGRERPLGRLLGQAEVIFEYRSNESSTSYQQREEYRRGFLLFLDHLWERIDLRNEIYHYVEGLFDVNVPAFQRDAVREALLNAVSHRDYRLSNSVFVKQSPTRLDIISPGSFPMGVTAENILIAQNPRNRLIAENLQRCGLIQRSGQGVDRMFEEMIKSGKRSPDFSKSDDHQVFLTLYGEVQDRRFLAFLQEVGEETLSLFNSLDLYALDIIHRGDPLPESIHESLPKLLAAGVIERFGKGRGRRYILSKQLCGFLEEGGVYTRTKGLDRETNKALLIQHIEENSSKGSKMRELNQVLPDLTYYRVQHLLRELKKEKKTHSVGKTSSARWFPGPARNKPKG